VESTTSAARLARDLGRGRARRTWVPMPVGRLDHCLGGEPDERAREPDTSGRKSTPRERGLDCAAVL